MGAGGFGKAFVGFKDDMIFSLITCNQNNKHNWRMALSKTLGDFQCTITTSSVLQRKSRQLWRENVPVFQKSLGVYLIESNELFKVHESKFLSSPVNRKVGVIERTS